MGKIINGFEKGLNVISQTLHQISNAVLLIVTLLITFDVLGRYFFNNPITGAFELTELGSAILVFFSLAITHRYREHVDVGFIVDKLPDKLRDIIEGIIELFVCLMILFMSWFMFQDGLRTMGRNLTTTVLGLPVHPFVIIASIGALVFALTALVKGLKHFVEAVGRP